MKRQAQTAIDVYYEDIKPTLGPRQRFVRGYLRDYTEKYRQSPTALELEQFMSQQCQFQYIDVNTVRPRLCEMEADGWVRHGQKRRCTISTKTVFTWEVSTPQQRPVEPIPQRLFA